VLLWIVGRRGVGGGRNVTQGIGCRGTTPGVAFTGLRMEGGLFLYAVGSEKETTKSGAFAGPAFASKTARRGKQGGSKHGESDLQNFVHWWPQEAGKHHEPENVKGKREKQNGKRNDAVHARITRGKRDFSRGKKPAAPTIRKT